MLIHLSIKNLAIIENIQAQGTKGMVSLTGESGSGKSLVASAIKLLSGDRFDKDLVGGHGDRLMLGCSFDVLGDEWVKKWLDEHGIDVDDICVIRRVMSQNSGPRVYINNTPVTLKQLKVLGGHLMTIHGQNFYNQLLDSSMHLQYLDRLIEPALLDSLKKIVQAYNKLLRDYQAAKNKQADQAQQVEFIRYQLEAFEAIELDEDNFESFEKEYQTLQSAQSAKNVLGEVFYQLSEKDASVISEIQNSIKALSPYAGSDLFDQILSDLAQGELLLADVVNQVKNLCGDSDQQNEKLHWMEGQINLLNGLCHKHRCTMAQLAGVKRGLVEKLAQFEYADILEAKSQKALESLKLEYELIAKKIATTRSENAIWLEKQVNQIIIDLNMLGQFHIKIAPQTIGENSMLCNNGLDEVIFLISPVKGGMPQPIDQVASGGELSRLALALEVATAQTKPSHLLLFDEVDSGIGGVSAEAVGHYLKKLSTHCQVICITHSAQVASKADWHWHINKKVESGQVYSTLKKLEVNQRVEVIAQMISGRDITDVTRLQAKQMLSVK